jgi:hypothetical protein
VSLRSRYLHLKPELASHDYDIKRLRFKEIGIPDLGFKAQGLGLRVLGFGVLGSGFRVQDL